MSRKRMIYFCVVMVVATLGYFGWKLTSRNAYESADYTVLELESPFELREYADLMMVTTEMQSESQNKDGSFMKLFRYISSSNDSQQKVAMTTPIFMEPEKLDDKGPMGFVIPKKVSEKHAPEPTNENAHSRWPAASYGEPNAFYRWVHASDDAGRYELDPVLGKPNVLTRGYFRENLGRVRLPHDVSPGSKFSRGDQLLQSSVFFFEFFHPLGLIGA